MDNLPKENDAKDAGSQSGEIFQSQEQSAYEQATSLASETSQETGSQSEATQELGTPAQVEQSSQGATPIQDFPPGGPPPFVEDKKKKYLIFAVLAIFLLLFIILIFNFIRSRVSGKPAAANITLNYWGLWEDNEILQSVIDEYQKQHSNITITYVKQDPKLYRERLQAAIDRGEGPDIFRFHNSWTPMLKNQLALLPKDIYSDADFEKTFYPVAATDVKIGDNYHGIPLEIDGLLLFYNEDILKGANVNVPVSWVDVQNAIEKITVKENDSDILDETLGNLANSIDIAPADALFQFESGKVTAFKPAESGRRLNQKKAKELVHSYVTTLTRIDSPNIKPVAFSLPIDVESPKITTENSNQYGIKELIGVGSSKFKGSISGRVANIVLSASRINGHLIPPGSIFSFNDTLGDVSASTGFQPAYIIKSGRTVLGDGGGVCQVSTTLFRAALDAGLPIVERNAHSYRVSYYEQDSSPGIDATVFAPSYDLKFKNNTDNYILIQAKPDAKNYSLIFEIYGTSDGRLAEITKPTILSQTPPPPDLFQDDPNLPVGEVKQVDFRATGAKVNFDYKVVKSGEVITQQSFFSNFAPWQAVFLRGTRT